VMLLLLLCFRSIEDLSCDVVVVVVAVVFVIL